jgi:predicted HTH domain antitoxin
MSNKDVEDQLAELTRRAEALEARLAELETPRALKEAGPTYRTSEAGSEISLFEARLNALVKQFSEIIEDWQDVQAMLEAEADYRAGNTVSFEELVTEVNADVKSSDELLSLREAGSVYPVTRRETDEDLAVPVKVLHASGLSKQELLVELAVHLFEEDFISLGIAKSLAGMPTAQFMKLLGSRHIPLHYDVEELEEDVGALKRLGLL